MQVAEGAEKLESLIGTMCCTKLISLQFIAVCPCFDVAHLFVTPSALLGMQPDLPRRELAAKPPELRLGSEWASAQT